VVAAFHHLPAKELGDLSHPVDADVLVCTDDAEAGQVVNELIAKMPGLRAVDAGRLASAGAIESFVAVLIGLNIRYKTLASVRFTGLDGGAGSA
jgi:NADPH-dependent F420 reductase